MFFSPNISCKSRAAERAQRLSLGEQSPVPETRRIFRGNGRGYQARSVAWSDMSLERKEAW